MRILYHHRTRAEDAQGIHISEMVKAFQQLGHQVEIVALIKGNEGGPKQGENKLFKWFPRWIPNWLYEIMSLTYNLYGYRCLCQVVKAKRPDLIYERYSLNTFCGIWASRRFGIPLVLEVNAPLYYEQNKLGKLTFRRMAKFSERWICSNSTLTIVVSNVMKKFLIREGVQDEKIVVIPNGIDPEKFHPGVSGRTVRESYSLNGKLVIGFVGWFRKWHGLEMLLELMHKAGLAEKNIGLLLVGDGPAYPELDRYVKQHNLESSVIFTGPIKREEIPAHIAAIDIAVQPSATEYACPIKIVEYMGMAKCIVAPDQANIREIIEDGVEAFLFKPGDKESLRSTLLNLLDNPARQKESGQRAHKAIFERKFLWRANAEKALNLVSGKEFSHE